MAHLYHQKERSNDPSSFGDEKVFAVSRIDNVPPQRYHRGHDRRKSDEKDGQMKKGPVFGVIMHVGGDHVTDHIENVTEYGEQIKDNVEPSERHRFRKHVDCIEVGPFDLRGFSALLQGCGGDGAARGAVGRNQGTLGRCNHRSRSEWIGRSKDHILSAAKGAWITEKVQIWCVRCLRLITVQTGFDIVFAGQLSDRRDGQDRACRWQTDGSRLLIDSGRTVCLIVLFADLHHSFL